MPTYIHLIRFTEQGIRSIKDGPSRLDAGRATAQSLGAEIQQFFLTMGQYDAVAVTQAPDDETAAKIVLAVAARGNVRTETLRAFTEDEYRRLIAALP